MWHRQFAARAESGIFDLNFVWQADARPVFVMDNHLAAAWCWAHALDRTRAYNLLHIDRHTDWLESRRDEWNALMPAFHELTLDNYAGVTFEIDTLTTPVMRWDNYLPLYCHKYPMAVANAIFATQSDGDEPTIAHQTTSPWELAENVEYWLTGEHQPEEQWIVNLDIDYFFSDAYDDGTIRWASNEYVDQVVRAIRAAYDRGRVAIITIALSPECCGGWPAAEQLCERVARGLGIDFCLPAETATPAE